MLEKILTKFSKRLCFVGYSLGIFAGFVTRDEYYYNARLNILFKRIWKINKPLEGKLAAIWQPISE